MPQKPLITAIVGTYRKGGVTDSAVDAVLAAAAEAGADTNKIYLLDRHIEFCTNCRTCTQEPGGEPGPCVLADDMPDLIAALRASRGIVLASPMNFWTVTAIMKRFIERLVCYAYWPWGQAAPAVRTRGRRDKVAVVVGASAAPALMARLLAQHVSLLRSVTRLLGARRTRVLFIGLAAENQHQDIGARARRRARRLGQWLAAEGARLEAAHPPTRPDMGTPPAGA
jgi:multimeric flavodoxin WrbA